MPDGPGGFGQDYTCPDLLRILLPLTQLTGTGLSPSMVTLSSMFPFVRIKISQSYNPDVAVTTPVWAISFSLATTREIDVSFSSSYYLDVSVHRVRSSLDVTDLLSAGLPHSDICGSTLFCKSPQLFAA